MYVTAKNEAVSQLMEEIAPLRRAGCTFIRKEHRVSSSKERWSELMTQTVDLPREEHRVSSNRERPASLSLIGQIREIRDRLGINQ